jgi:hypothetical protein
MPGGLLDDIEESLAHALLQSLNPGTQLADQRYASADGRLGTSGTAGHPWPRQPPESAPAAPRAALRRQ